MNWSLRRSTKSRWPWTPIERLLVGTYIGICLLILGAGAIILSKQKQDFYEATRRQMSLATQLKASLIEAWRKERINDLEQLLESSLGFSPLSQFLGNPAGANRAAVQSWFAAWRRPSDYERILLLDSSFRLLMTLPEDHYPVDLANLSQSYRSAPSPYPVTADLRYDPASRLVKMELLAPIIQPGRKVVPATLDQANEPPLGYVCLQLNPDLHLYPLLQNLPSRSQTSESWLARQEHNGLLCISGLRQNAQAPFRMLLPLPPSSLAALAQGMTNEVVEHFLDYRQVPVLAIIRALPQSGWLLTTQVDEAEIYAPLRLRLGVTVILGILLAAGSGLAVAVLWQAREAAFARKEWEVTTERQSLYQRFILLNQQANDMILLVDHEWRILEANDRALDTYEYSLAELKAMRFHDLWPPEGRENLSRQLAQFNLTEGALLEAEHHRKVGPCLPVECSLRETRIQGATFYQIFIRNITERKQREQTIRRTQRLYAVLSQVNQTMVWTKSKEQLFQKVCQIAVESGGISLALIGGGKPAEARMSPWAHYGPHQQFIQALSSPHPQASEDPLLTSLQTGQPWIANDLQQQSQAWWQGEALTCGLHAAASFPIRTRAGHPGALVLFADEPGFFSPAETRLLEEVSLAISFALNLLEQETQRQRAEEELQLFFDTALDMLCLAGFDGWFKKLSPAWSKTLGWTAAELLGKPYLEFVHPADRAITLEANETLKKGQKIVNFENRFLARNGSVRWLAWNSYGHLERQLIIAAARDVTDRKQTEEELHRYAENLRQSNDEVKQFAYIVSHDLRGPLVNLRGFTAELRNTIGSIQPLLEETAGQLRESQRHLLEVAFKQDIAESLQFIDAAVAHMDSFVSALLKLSRLGHRELQPDTLDLNELVNNTLQSLAHQIKAHPATVTVGHLPPVVADRTAMEQVIDNLLGNAVKYLEAGRPGIIEISGERGLFNTRYQIRDNGRGISTQDMEKVFAPFRRAGKQDVPGDGMGLAYVQMLLRRHGGKIECESVLGVGTTFVFTLPNHSVLNPAPSQKSALTEASSPISIDRIPNEIL